MNRKLGTCISKNLRGKNAVYFIAESGKEIIGYCWAKIGKNSSKCRNRQIGYIAALYVRPEHQSKGVGSSLVDTTIGWFKDRGITEVRIKVFDYNKEVHELYKRLGFKDYIMDMIRD